MAIFGVKISYFFCAFFNGISSIGFAVAGLREGVILISRHILGPDLLMQQLLNLNVVEPRVRHNILVVILGSQTLLGVLL